MPNQVSSLRPVETHVNDTQEATLAAPGKSSNAYYWPTRDSEKRVKPFCCALQSWKVGGEGQEEKAQGWGRVRSGSVMLTLPPGPLGYEAEAGAGRRWVLCPQGVPPPQGNQPVWGDSPQEEALPAFCTRGSQPHLCTEPPREPGLGWQRGWGPERRHRERNLWG